MAVSLLTITHGRVGHELLATAESMLSKLPLRCDSLSVSDTCNPDDLLDQAKNLCAELDDGDGILVLTDIFGSTPSNICNKLNSVGNTHIIAGMNLPMLIRVMNYPNLSLNELVEKAISGGHDGIID
ncbi:MAG: PTS sugar transporter subunit IIA [Gammaproteobacteria bacterium]